MTAINLPGQLEVPLVVDHKTTLAEHQAAFDEMYVNSTKAKGIRLAELLVQYEERPTSETWSRIQALAKEILK